jgi:CheY-like chemotaxis protein
VTTTPSILLIDDNPDDRTLAIRALQQDDPAPRVAEITSSEAFEQALTTGAFDVVVTNYLLRWSDGLTVLRWIKRRLAVQAPDVHHHRWVAHGRPAAGAHGHSPLADG